MIDTIGHFEPFVLFELANTDKLIKGQKYYIKDNEGYIKVYARFCSYYDEKETSEGLFSAHANYTFVNDFDQSIVYRCISREEFYKKVKEKYDAKCLNIILKRLIDDMFEW